MSTYRPLYSFRIEHDYFVGGICRALQCAVLPSGQELMTQRGLLLRQTAQTEWTVLYDADGAGVDTASDAIALGLSISDPAFVLYTEWQGFNPAAVYRLDLPLADGNALATKVIVDTESTRRIGMPLCTICLHLTDDVWQAAVSGSPKNDTIKFQAPERYWEYIIIKQNSNREVLLERLKMDTDKKLLTFKTLERTSEFGRDAYRTVSEEAVPIRERYDFRLNLIATPENSNRQKQVLLRNVEHPKPGQFKSDADKLRQVCYF